MQTLTKGDLAMLTKDDYQNALWSQDACNLSGIVRSFHLMLERVWEEARAKGEGTDYVNSHPVSRLFAEQIMHLSKGCDYSDAYAYVRSHLEEVTPCTTL